MNANDLMCYEVISESYAGMDACRDAVRHCIGDKMHEPKEGLNSHAISKAQLQSKVFAFSIQAGVRQNIFFETESRNDALEKLGRERDDDLASTWQFEAFIEYVPNGHGCGSPTVQELVKVRRLAMGGGRGIKVANLWGLEGSSQDWNAVQSLATRHLQKLYMSKFESDKDTEMIECGLEIKRLAYREVSMSTKHYSYRVCLANELSHLRNNVLTLDVSQMVLGKEICTGCRYVGDADYDSLIASEGRVNMGGASQEAQSNQYTVMIFQIKEDVASEILRQRAVAILQHTGDPYTETDQATAAIPSAVVTQGKKTKIPYAMVICADEESQRRLIEQCAAFQGVCGVTCVVKASRPANQRVKDRAMAMGHNGIANDNKENNESNKDTRDYGAAARTGGFGIQEIRELKDGLNHVKTALQEMSQDRDTRLIPAIQTAVKEQVQNTVREEMHEFQKAIIAEMKATVKVSVKEQLEEWSAEQLQEEDAGPHQAFGMQMDEAELLIQEVHSMGQQVTNGKIKLNEALMAQREPLTGVTNLELTPKGKSVAQQAADAITEAHRQGQYRHRKAMQGEI